MQKATPVSYTIFLAAFAVISWFALLLQLYLIIANRKLSVAATVVQYFSFFTILTNILVAVCFTSLLRPAANSFFTKPKTLAATAVYITIVGAIYNGVLRQLWDPQGWQLLADNLLHTVVPVLFVVYWIVAVPKSNLKWNDIFPWLIYPAVYLVYILIRGVITNLYPYPFTDVAMYGYAKVLANSGWVMVGFVGVSLLFIGIGKLFTKSADGK